MYRLVDDRWIDLDLLYKGLDREIPEGAEKWEIDKIMSDARLVEVTKTVLRKNVYGIEEATLEAMESIGRDNLYSIDIYGCDSYYMVIEDKDQKNEFLQLVGDGFNNADRGEL